MESVLKRLREANLTVTLSKCKFAQHIEKFLGHNVGSWEISPSEDKQQAIKDSPIAINKKQLREYLGMVGYYARYIKNYATIEVPLTDALKEK